MNDLYKYLIRWNILFLRCDIGEVSMDKNILFNDMDNLCIIGK